MKSKKIACLLFSTMLLLQTLASAQPARKNSFGVSTFAAICGGGHGITYTPAVFVAHKNSMVAAGPLYSSGSKSIRGFHAGYEHILCRTNGDRGRMQLFAFGTVNYRHAAGLSATMIQLEERENRAMAADIRLKTWEAFGGMGLRVKLLNRVQWANAIGFGFYYSPHCPEILNYDRSAPCIALRTGLYIDLTPSSGASF
jgi:hypothetical protein